jgi:hypothetical protein
MAATWGAAVLVASNASCLLAVTAVTVTNANDSGPGSLRAAMAGNASLIDFSPSFFSTPRTIALLSPLPSINGDLVILGPGANLLRVDGQLRSNSSALITIYGSPTVRLEGFTLAGGYDALSTGDVGGIFTRADLTLAKMNIAENRGAAVFNQGGNLTMVESSIVGNAVRGLHNQGGKATIVNSTIAENQLGGVINQVGDMAIFNSTIARNGLFGVDSIIFTSSPPMGSLTIESSILADNAAQDLGFNRIVSLKNSLVETLFGPVSGGSGNILGVDPALGPLSVSGGTTPTLTPQPGSPVIDAGSNPRALAVDQRGAPRVLGQRIDIGAVETVPEPNALAIFAVVAACRGAFPRQPGLLCRNGLHP